MLWALLAGLAVLAAALGWLAWSRHWQHRSRPLTPPVIERPSLAERPAPDDTQPIEESAHSGEPQGQKPATASELVLDLEARRMSATLVNAVLSYRLAVTNGTATPLHKLTIAGDMIAAHASRPADELLGADVEGLPVLHRVPILAPGETVTLAGDIRLPLSAITPIRRGEAALFVPLARVRAEATTPEGEEARAGGTFLVGQEAASARLQPFRLDLGPRLYSKIGQRLLPAAA